MFGFKIVRESSLDRKDLQSFKQITESLHEHCIKFNELVTQHFDVSDAFMSGIEEFKHLTYHLTMAYTEHRFASQLNTINFCVQLTHLSSAVDECLRCMRWIMSSSQAYRYTMEEYHRTKEMDIDDVPSDIVDSLHIEAENLTDNYHKMTNDVIEQIKRHISDIIDCNNNIRIGVSRDIIRILAGVDIIREYHNKQRQKLPAFEKESMIMKFMFLKRSEFNKYKKESGNNE